MKQLMQGNTAAARGIWEAGCCFASSYPGTPSTEITEELAKYNELYSEWAPNEKVAMESAFGASLAGKRSFCAMKHVGLNVAADPLFTVSYTGINAGMVICVADDAGMHSSQNEQDSRHYARAAKLPMLEPSDSQEALDFFRRAYDLSEEYDSPVIVKMCTRIAHSQSAVETGERVSAPEHPYTKNIAKYVMMPGNAIKRHPVVEERMRRLQAFAETSDLNRTEQGSDSAIGIITSSTCYQYVKEACGDRFPVLKLGMIWPLPDDKLKNFAGSVKRLVIVEELDGFIESYCLSLGLKCEGKSLFGLLGELSPNVVAEKLGLSHGEGVKLSESLPARPPMMCAGCPHRGIFYTLSKLKCTVLGDIGCYTLGAVAPLSAMEMTLCMGASVSAIHGFNKAEEFSRNAEGVSGDGSLSGNHNGISISESGSANHNGVSSPDNSSENNDSVSDSGNISSYELSNKAEKLFNPPTHPLVAVIGDSTFMHSGMTGLANIAYNQSKSTVIILDNSITGMTGHQQNPTTGLNIKGDPAGKIDLESLCRAMGFSRVRVVDPYNLTECENALREELAANDSSVIISRRPCALLKYVKHNPPLTVDTAKCVTCKSCTRIGCPALSIKDGKAHVDSTLCVGCGVCTQLCKFGAFSQTEGR
ncbi:MAG: indolepyruvate ferredoxin oxidoreductase subunit alpha [Synergistaceae bacterium]|nr:indolepyruvate ferredoxin oxidoreductase subunit alpha [Synergistaceae bacterium]